MPVAKQKKTMVFVKQHDAASIIAENANSFCQRESKIAVLAHFA